MHPPHTHIQLWWSRLLNVPNAAENGAKSHSTRPQELTVATGLLRDQSCPFFFILIVITMTSPRTEIWVCSVHQCLASARGGVDQLHEGSPFFASPCIHTMPFAIWLAFISLKRQILLSSLLNLGCPCDFFCPAENKQEKKSMHHSESWLQKALPISTSPLTLCHHHEKDILKPVCLSQNKDESHGGKARLPRLFQPRPSKMSQQTDSGPTDTQVNLGKPAGHSSWPGPKLS